MKQPSMPNPQATWQLYCISRKIAADLQIVYFYMCCPCQADIKLSAELGNEAVNIAAAS